MRLNKGVFLAGTVCVLSTAFISHPSWAQNKPSAGKPPISKVLPAKTPVVQPGPKIEKPELFFAAFAKKKSAVPKRDPFETDAEFAARQPPKWDDSKIVYFEAEPRALGEPFTYDLASQKLTLFVGGFYKGHAIERGSYKTVNELAEDGSPFCVKTIYTRGADYIGENSFGVKKKISKVQVDTYVVLIANANVLPVDLYEKDEVQNTLTPFLTIDRAEAKTMTAGIDAAGARGQVLCGFKIADYSASHDAADYKEPTTDDPQEKLTRVHLLKADLVRVMVVDRASKKIYADFPIKPALWQNVESVK